MKHQNLTRKNVKVKFHPGDLSRIHVFDPFEERYIEVSALDQLYTQGLSLWKHRVILRFTKETEPKVDLAALGRAKRKLRQIIEEARSRKRISGRHRIARFKEGGKTPSLQNKPKENSSSGHQLHGKAKVKKKKKTLPARKSQGTNERLDVLVEEGWTVEMPPSSEDVGE
jgi:putative transposase